MLEQENENLKRLPMAVKGGPFCGILMKLKLYLL